MKILIVEDNFADVEIIQLALGEKDGFIFEINHIDRLGEALNDLEKNFYDVILADLGLPDSQGINTFIRLHEFAPAIPIIVMTGMSDDTLATKALRAGAQDFIIKDLISTDLLHRSIRYSIERYHLLEELETARRREQDARELSSIERISSATKTSVTAQMFGVLPLRESAPNYFDSLVESYKKIIDMALDQRILRVEYNIEEELNNMAEQLGLAKAGPRDVIDIYVKALKSLSRTAPPKKAQVYAEEGRLLVLELMGDLVMFYRKYFTGRIRMEPTDKDTDI